MKITFKYIFFFNVLAIFNLNAQHKSESKANAQFDNYAFSEAISSYESLVQKGHTSKEIFENLGNANYLNANYDEASQWYGKLMALEDTNIEPEYLYRYAQSLKSLQEYEDSEKWMKKFKEVKSGDNRAEKFNNSLDYLEAIKKNSGRFALEDMSINSSASDFSPSFYGDSLVFSTARDSGLTSRNINLWNKEPFLNLYFAKVNTENHFTNPKKFSKDLNKKTHESSTAFTKDGNTLYFTRNNSHSGNFSRDHEGVSRLKIFRASKIDGEWTDIVELSFNGDDFSTAHPALHPDESRLYFSSDREGTIGASDIFVVDILGDDKFGKPVSLGPKINTESRETFPFITDSGTLYFASDGHPGLGGLDVFAVNLDNLDNSDVVNIGEPVNSAQDDFSFILDENTQKGFIASNREGGLGSDDIYAFTQLEKINFDCQKIISGTVKDEQTMLALKNAIVSLFDGEGHTLSTIPSAADGSFVFEADCLQDSLNLKVAKDKFDEKMTSFSLNGLRSKKGIEIVLEKSQKRAEAGVDLIKYLNLEPVYFDLDKFDIRSTSEITIQKIADYMKEFPKIKIEVRSHTDAKASKLYNYKLSEKRAAATVGYLTTLGINPNQISDIGFGETQLINQCNTRAKCNDNMHQLNRRSEFIVIE